MEWYYIAGAIYLAIGFVISMAWVYTGVILNAAMSAYSVPWKSFGFWIDLIGMIVMITLFWLPLILSTGAIK